MGKKNKFSSSIIQTQKVINELSNKNEKNKPKNFQQQNKINKKMQQNKNNKNQEILNKTKQIKKQIKQVQNTSKANNQFKKNQNKNISQNKKSKNQNQENQTSQVKGKLWSELQYKLRDQIIFALNKCKFKTMMPVQEASIPLLLKNYDLAVQAQTGSGKTLSFAVPLLEKYLSWNLTSKKNSNENQQDTNNKPISIAIRYLIISPTRQLCQQTFNVITKLIQNLPSKQRAQTYLKYCHCATGGSQIAIDIQKLKQNTMVFVATVGRIRELSQKMDQNWLKKVQYLYIDQADRVLKQKGIQQLIRIVQKIRRTAIFSATLQTLQQKNYQFYGMRNLAKISLKQTNSNNSNKSQNKQLNTQSNFNQQEKKYIIPKSLTNTFLKMPSRLQKMQFLTNFIKSNIQNSKIIVFFNTCASVDFYTKIFNSYFNLKQEQQIVGLHGKLKSKRRQRLINSFLNKMNGCLFATDVVSRGIDFDHIHYILQVDPPEDPDNYVHRIGRTARINRPGTAILLIQEHQQTFINYLAEKSVGVQEIVDINQYYNEKQAEKITEISQKIDCIMRTDRDYVQKSKKAFVSYIRSYKQHDLRYIFEFKKLDIGLTAYSFFMYRIPRIKQILGKSISSFKQSQVDIESIPWLDKNQQMQYQKKRQRREQQLKQKKKLQMRLLKNADAKNNKSKRKRIKAKMEKINNQFFIKQHKELVKQKNKRNRNQNSDESDNSENQYQNDSFEQEDTQQIERRMSQGNKKSNLKGKKK